MKRNKVLVEMPYPPSELSPNKRVFRFKKNEVFQAYRRVAFDSTRLATSIRNIKPSRHMQKYSLIEVQYVVEPPDYRRRDEDNFIACMKSAQDGIAAALGVDDAFFHLKEIVHKPKVKGGRVTAIVTWTTGVKNV